MEEQTRKMTKEMEVLRQENKHNFGGTNIDDANKKNMHNKVCNLIDKYEEIEKKIEVKQTCPIVRG